MIITLEGADFSADNIGQVELERQLNEYTLAAITASGNENLTESQQYALDDLFLALGADGSNNILSKIRKLYLPMIASEVGNALINYATNNFTKDFTPNSANWELRNLGITQKASGQTFLISTFSPALVATNITQMWLRTENMVRGTDDKNFIFVLRGKTNDSKFLGVAEMSASSDNYIQWGATYGYNNFATTSKDTDQRVASGFSIRGSSDYSVIRYSAGLYETTITPSTQGDMSGESAQSLYLLGLGDQRAPKPFGFMMLGEGIPEADFLNIASKVNALYIALGGQTS